MQRAAAFDASGNTHRRLLRRRQVKSFVDVESRALGHETPGHNDPVSAAVFDRKGKFLVTAGADASSSAVLLRGKVPSRSGGPRRTVVCVTQFGKRLRYDSYGVVVS